MVDNLDFETYVSSLEEAGFCCTWYGLNENESELRNGLAYYENQDQVIKVFYSWKKIDGGYHADRIFRIEDVSSCYR